MSRTRILSGFLLSLLLLQGMQQVAFAEEKDPADGSGSILALLKEALKQEQRLPPSIAAFAKKTATEAYDDLSDQDIADAVQSNMQSLCAKKGEGDTAIGYDACNKLQDDILKVVGRETSLRSLGRDLQAIASGYEVPMRDGQAGAVAVNSPIAGILNIWRVHGSGSVVGSGALVRSALTDPEEIKPIAEQLKEAYEKLADNEAENEEQQRAAVWRYSMGVRLARNERKGFPAPEEYDTKKQPDRQYLFKRWEKIEDLLNQIWGIIKAAKFDPPLQPGEIAFFTLDSSKMPTNVELWGYVEKPNTKNATNGTPAALDGDVGMRFRIPLDPAFPSLMKEGIEEPVLGGTYPPEPVEEQSGGQQGQKKKPIDGRSLCSGPISRRGYLCRQIDAESIDCAESPKVTDPDVIALTSCTKKTPLTEDETWCCVAPQQQSGGEEWDKKSGGTCQILTKDACEQQGKKMENVDACAENGCDTIASKVVHTTASGPDVCSDVEWSQWNPDTQCKITLRCSDDCGNDSSKTYGKVDLKTADGTIDVCLSKDGQGANIPGMMHELVHASQECGLPPGSGLYQNDPKELAKLSEQELQIEQRKCCAIEGEAYRAEYESAAEQGYLQNPDGSWKESSTGIPFTPDALAEAHRSFGCGHLVFGDDFHCAESREYPPSFLGEGISLITQATEDAKLDCDKVAALPLMKQFKDSVETQTGICRPYGQTEFENTIGNTMCFVGACVETSAEVHRTIPGRIGAGVQDEAFPFDSKLKAPDDKTDFLTAPPGGSATLPPYAPRRLLAQLDGDFCRQLGLPPLSPSALCVITTNRTLQLPLADYITSAEELYTNQEQMISAVGQREALSAALGARIGSSLYEEHLRRFGRSFSEVLLTMGRLLTTLKDTSFPTEMCTLGAQ